MKHRFRFFLPTPDLRPGTVEIVGSEGHHALHVARVRPGERIEVFDGAGRLAEATVVDLNRKSLTAQVDTPRNVSRQPPRVTLLCGSLGSTKGLHRLIDGCVPFEPHEIGLFSARYSSGERKNNPKWNRWAVESAKQCGSNWIPDFTVYRGLEEALDAHTGARLIAASPEGIPRVKPLASERAVVVVIGPEGGFSHTEYEQMSDRGAEFLGLAPTVLRTELAAAVALSHVRSSVGREA